MTRALGRDPARCCLSLAEWPALDAAIWREALAPADLLETGGERARHAAGSNRAAEGGYGRWLTWLSHTGQLDLITHSANRITPARVDAYLTALATTNSTATQRRRLEELFILASLLDPRRSWQWIRDLATRVRWRDKPVRDKRSRLVGADDLLALGHRLMDQAEQAEQDHPWCRALLYRDGLALALLAQRPLRRANFAGLLLGQHVLRRGAGWWLQIEAHETKTHAPIEVPWPETLVAALEVYLVLRFRIGDQD